MYNGLKIDENQTLLFNSWFLFRRLGFALIVVFANETLFI